MMKILTFIVATAALCVASNASAAILTGVTNSNSLVTFDTSDPTSLLSAKPISGMAANEIVRGIDYRPTTSLLYALGSFGNVYTIDPNTIGVATATAAFNVNSDPTLIADGGLSGSNFGVDFNPSADASGSNSLRIVSNTNQNLAVNVGTGAVLVATDVSYGGSPNPNIVGEAYTNSFLGGSTIGTTQYAIDSGTDNLVLQAFNAGTLTNVGSLTLNASADVGFEIVAFNNGANVGYATIDSNGTNTSNLYRINLSTGAATDLGPIDGGLLVPNLTSNPSLIQNQVPEPASFVLLGLGVAGVALARRSR